MFNELRRPVPSKAALRILYQLAYVTSGTAMGIATLCVEERRRKTQLVQKIADNAKRIRQSPKYRPYSAVAAAKSVGLDEPVTLKQAMHGHFQPAPRDQYSPSEVQRGYRMAVKQHRKAARRRKPSGDAEEGLKQAGDQVSAATGPPLDSNSNAKSLREAGKRSRATDGISRHEHFRIYKRPRQERVLDYIGISKVALAKQPTELLLRCVGAPERLQLDDICRFFQVEPWTYSGDEEKRIAQRLFAFALENGGLQHIRSLYNWMYSRGALEEAQVKAFCNACHDMPVDGDQEEFLDLYCNLFRTAEFGNLAAIERARHCLEVAIAGTCWDNPKLLKVSHSQFVAERLRLRTVLLRIQSRDITEAVEGLCHQYLAAKDPDRAFRLLQLISKKLWPPERRDIAKTLGPLRQKVAVANLELGHFDLAFFEVLQQIRDNEDPLPYLERLALASVDHSSYRSIAMILRNRSERVDAAVTKAVPRLSNVAKIAFVRASLLNGKLQSNEDLFQRIFSALPHALREDVADNRTRTSLQQNWTATRNLEATWDHYKAASEFATRNGAIESINRATLTMIDILNQANQPERAIDLLKSLTKVESDSCNSLARAAVSLAQMKLWDRLKALLKILQESASFVQNVSVTRCFNRIIQLFAQHHTPADTWKFVTDLIHDLKFEPSNITTRIVITSFVEKRHLSYFMHWIRYLGTLGQQYKLDDKTVANLMSVYVLDQRPAHELVMWYCRKLVPMLETPDASVFRRVLTEAIAHDLRKRHRSAGEKAVLNLAELQRHEGAIPRPVGVRGVLSTALTGLNEDAIEIDHLNGHDRTTVNTANELELHDHNISRRARADEASNTEAPSKQTQPGMFHDDEFEDHSRLDADDAYSRQQSQQRKQIEGQMIELLSQRHYGKVLETYSSSLSPEGLPVSIRALTIAVDASLRWREGDRSEADQILTKARLAGMDVSLASRPLLEHRISAMRLGSKDDASRLREMVMEWYNANAEKGWLVDQNLGVRAAKALINARHPEHAINLLSILREMHSTHDVPLSIDVMTVYLQCYASMENLAGIEWTIHTVLQRDIPIKLEFLRRIRVWRNRSRAAPITSRAISSEAAPRLETVLQRALEVCRRRRLRQRHYAKVYGRNLVAIIQKLKRQSQEPAIPVAARKPLEADLFAKPHTPGVQSITSDDAVNALTPEVRLNEDDSMDIQSDTFQTIKTSIARSIQHTRRPLAHRYRKASITRGHIWEKQYRAFLRKNFVFPNGQLAAFRYWLWRERTSKKSVVRPKHALVNTRIDRLEVKSDDLSRREVAPQGYRPFSDARGRDAGDQTTGTDSGDLLTEVSNGEPGVASVQRSTEPYKPFAD